MTTLDVSNYSYDAAVARGQTIPQWMACLKAAGVTRIVVNAWDPGKSSEMIRAARNIGIACDEVYCFLYYGLPHENWEVDHALYLQTTEGLREAWLDCEAHWRPDTPTEAQGTTTGYRIQATAKARARVIQAGMRSGIYTGRDWWMTNMGNFSGFADAGDELWFANYGLDDPTAPANPIPAVDFGGWTKVRRHQYSSKIVVCGRTEDHNYDFLLEDEMTPQERAEFDALKGQVTRLNAIVAGNGSFPVVANAGNLLALADALKAGSIQPGKLYQLTGEQTLQFLWKQGNSAYLGLLNMQRDFATLADQVREVADFGSRATTTLTDLIGKYEAIAEGISALDDALASFDQPAKE